MSLPMFHNVDLPDRPLREAQIQELRERAAAYGRRCPFKPGDLVTARSGTGSIGAGDPHIVLEVLPTIPEPDFHLASGPGDTTHTNYGRRIDMRVLMLGGDNQSYMGFWVESWEYVPYEEKAS